jgi:hypothetical protein
MNLKLSLLVKKDYAGSRLAEAGVIVCLHQIIGKDDVDQRKPGI